MQGTETFFVFFSTLHKTALSLSPLTVRFSDLSTFTPDKDSERNPWLWRVQQRPNSMFAKEHFYMFSCDSTSLTENSWSVPEKGKKERKKRKKDSSSKLGQHDMMDLGYDKQNWKKTSLGTNYTRFAELYFLVSYCATVLFSVRLTRLQNIFKIVQIKIRVA